MKSAGARMRTKYLKYFCLAACLAAPIASASDDGDDARFATQQLREGKILPLSEILSRVEHVTGGNVLEVEAEHEDHGLVYEVYFLDPNGQRHEIYVDAATGEILKQKLDDNSDARSSD